MDDSIPIAAQIAATAGIAIVGIYVVAAILKAVFVILGALFAGLLWGAPFFLVAAGISAFSLPVS